VNQADVMAPGINILSTVPERGTLFAEHFTSLENWTTGGSGNHWGLGTTTDDRQVLTMGANGANYGNDVDNWVTTADPLNFSGRAGIKMDFQITGTCADDGDHLSVEASTDQINWVSLHVGIEDNGPTKTIGGSFPAWQRATVDLKIFDDNLAVYLRFRFTSDASGTAAGYSIAELSITCAATTDKSDTYQYYNGTSMSAAYASGVAALVLSRKPALTTIEVKLVIETSVDQKPQLAGYVASAGRINAYNALDSVANVELQTQTLTSDRISLDWASRQEDASGFEIWRRVGHNGNFVTIAITGPDDGTYTDSGLSANTTYIYRILSLKGVTRTGYSNEASATTFHPPDESVSDSGANGGGGCFIGALTSAMVIDKSGQNK
jgi:subtilisin family serine protease